MANIMDTARIAAKWARVTPTRTEDYSQGVQNPRRDWQQATIAASDVYKQEVTKAANEGRFSKGVQRAGSQKWQAKTLEKGVQRWGPGVSVAEPDFAAGYEPIRQAIAAVQLPPRRGKMDPANFQRVQLIAKAAHDAKLKRS